jgi:AraC family transcriptional regulator, regulatory protein of adaptative response / methylated-DNA-[protein]-cysteine methyltransferase
MSPGYFHRLFKTATGLTPKDYANAHRAVRMKQALPKWKTVTEAINEAGFNSNGRFYAGSSKMLGRPMRVQILVVSSLCVRSAHSS